MNQALRITTEPKTKTKTPSKTEVALRDALISFQNPDDYRASFTLNGNNDYVVNCGCFISIVGHNALVVARKMIVNGELILLETHKKSAFIKKSVKVQIPGKPILKYRLSPTETLINLLDS